MGKPERSLVTRRPNVQGKTRTHTQTVEVERTRETQNTCTMLVCLYEEERCMGKPERSLLTRRPNVQGKIRTHTQTLVRLYEEERCMGTPERSLLTRRPKVQGETRTHAQTLVRLYEEERCMGTPETLPRHKTVERTRKTYKTQDTRIMLVCLHEEESCMGKPERSLVTRRPNIQGKRRTHAQTIKRTRKTQTHTQCSYAFMRRRGAWASPNAPSPQDDQTYKGKHEHTHKRSNVQGGHKHAHNARTLL